MPYIPLEKIVTKECSVLYRLVLTASARANELIQGAQPLVKSESKKVAVIALQEIAAGKIRYEINEPKSKKSEE